MSSSLMQKKFCTVWEHQMNTAVTRKVVQENRTRQCRKVLWVMGFMVVHWGIRCYSDREGKSTKKWIYAFSFLVGKHREPQSISAKLFLPIIPIDIVAYSFTLLWDNLCWNSCMVAMKMLYHLNQIFCFLRDFQTCYMHQNLILRTKCWHIYC